MNCTTPRYLLYARADRHDPGSWQFTLRSPDGSEELEAADVEPKVRGDRLDLLTLVRALESLDQPSQIALVGCSRYIRQGIEHGLSEWRENGWRWEFFGDMVPVRNGDLWQRLDRALRFHRVGCCRRRFDPPHAKPVRADENRGENMESAIRVADHDWVKYEKSSVSGGLRRLAAMLNLRDHRVVRWWVGLLSFGWTARNGGARLLGKTA